MMMEAGNRVDGRRARGDASRRTALAHAARIAMSEGLEGISFGLLAREAAMPKSSLQILFGDRETLQLQTLQASVDQFADRVVAAARAVPDLDGRPLGGLCAAWFDAVRNVDCDGCLLTAVVAEYRGRPGVIRDTVARLQGRWDAALRAAADRARAIGELADDTDIDQLVFEILALQAAANDGVRAGDRAAVDRAANAVQARLDTPPRRM